jgi:hypothetical protein
MISEGLYKKLETALNPVNGEGVTNPELAHLRKIAKSTLGGYASAYELGHLKSQGTVCGINMERAAPRAKILAEATMAEITSNLLSGIQEMSKLDSIFKPLADELVKELSSKSAASAR